MLYFTVPIPRDKELDPKFSLNEEDFVIATAEPEANPGWIRISMFAVVLKVNTRHIAKTGQHEDISKTWEHGVMGGGNPLSGGKLTNTLSYTTQYSPPLFTRQSVMY